VITIERIAENLVEMQEHARIVTYKKVKNFLLAGRSPKELAEWCQVRIDHIKDGRSIRRKKLKTEKKC